MATGRFEFAKRLVTGGLLTLGGAAFQFASVASPQADKQSAEFAAFAILAQGIAGLIFNLSAASIDQRLNQQAVQRNHLIRQGIARALLEALEQARRRPGLCVPAELYQRLFDVWCDELRTALEPGNPRLDALLPIHVSEIQWQAITRYDAHYDQDWLSGVPEEIRARYEAEAEADAAALAEFLRGRLTSDADSEIPSIVTGELYSEWGDSASRHFARAVLPLYRVAFAKIFSEGGAISEAVNYKGLTSIFESLRRIESKTEEILAALKRRKEERIEAPKSATRIPYRLPIHFMGREDVLSEIEQTLKKHKVIALVGMRGSGKSTVAAAYADRHEAGYRARWWLRAETESEICTDLVALAVRLGWVQPGEQQDVPVDEVLDRLAAEGNGILLIYDNAVDAKVVYRHLPKGGAAHAVITSNGHAWGNVAHRMEIRLWPRQVGADYLMARLANITGESERPVAEGLSEQLDGLPLALEVAAAYCERLDIPLTMFQKRYQGKGLELFGNEPPPPSYNLTVTQALALGEADKQHPAAGSLLQHFALLAAGPIPLFLFDEGWANLAAPLPSQLAGGGLDEAVGVLRGFELIERERIADERDPEIKTNTVRLHRLVREVAAARCTGQARDAALAGLVKAVAAVYPPDDYLDLLTNWPRARRLDMLAFELVDPNASCPAGAELEASRLMEKFAAYRNACTTAHGQVRMLLDRALQIRRLHLGAAHPEVAQILNRLGLLSMAEGDLPTAQAVCERALALREAVLPPEHTDIAQSHLNLGRILLDLGQIERASQHCARALSIYEAALGPDHPHVATGLTTLAHTEQDVRLAAPHFERAWRIYEAALGAVHPAVAGSILNLAEVSERRGELPAARESIARAIAIYTQCLGPDHRLIGYSLSRLAEVLQKQGDTAGARDLLEHALPIYESWYGPTHPNCAELRSRLEALAASQPRTRTSTSS